MKRSQWFIQLAWAIALSKIADQAVRAQESPGTDAPLPIPIAEIPQPGEIERPSTSAEILVQSPAPSNPPSVPPNLGGKQGSVIEVTGVQANPTDIGVELILQTTQGEALQPRTFALGRSYIANIPNAQLRLPSGDAFTFRSQNPVAGLMKITVTNLDANTIRVTVAGEQELPTVELFDSNEGLIFALTPAATAMQPPATPQETPSAPQDEQIELLVTGEQEEGYRVPDTSVGTRTDTPLRDIPQTINVVPQEVLRDQNVTNFNEALSNVPGVAPVNSSTSEYSAFAIRGFYNFNFYSSNVLRNGLRQGDLDSEVLPNVERIEVLKGPASVLYGTGNLGGTINIVTEQPLRDPFMRLKPALAAMTTTGVQSIYQDR